MKISTVFPCLQKIRSTRNHVTHLLSSSDISISSPEISNFCYIKKYRYGLHFDTYLLILLTLFAQLNGWNFNDVSKIGYSTITHINSETNPPLPIINVVCKYLRQFLGTFLGALLCQYTATLSMGWDWFVSEKWTIPEFPEILMCWLPLFIIVFAYESNSL